jgi:phage-related protein
VIKRIEWVGSSRKDIRGFPDGVRDSIGYAMYAAQQGGRAANVKPLHGFGGASVLEVVEDYDGGTYRAVYTVRFSDAIYVLHVFQKKSKRGAQTPVHEMNVIRERLQAVEAHHRNNQK